eukprot:jgi/Mesen1/10328/ME000797S09807
MLSCHAALRRLAEGPPPGECEDGVCHFEHARHGRPLPCCGCGVGLCLFLVGFVFPVAWYAGVIIFCCVKSINSDPREYAGLLACTVAAVVLVLLGMTGGAMDFF